jgi:alanine racemase
MTGRSRVDADTAAAIIDLDALERNILQLRARLDEVPVMAVVKGDAYGHGMVDCARAARNAGAEWLGVATPAEAMWLREAGDTQRLLCWLYGPETELAHVVDADVDITVHSAEQLSMISAVAATLGHAARVQLKIDTGLSRNGAPAQHWEQLCLLAREAIDSGAITVTGIWSHLAAADDPTHPSVTAQQENFAQALKIADAAGLPQTLRHLANSDAALQLPDARYDLVRLGICCYGIDPAGGTAGIQLEPVMTVRARLAAVKSLAAGAGVSYGHTWVADTDTVVGLVPIGYADGIPWQASNRAEVMVGGRRAPIRGRVCMDQFVVDLGPGAADAAGDEVTIFGNADDGVTAADWATACGTISYDIVTRIGPCLERIHRRAGAVSGDG